MSPERDDAAYRECTRDPIFLFQARRWHLTGDPESKGLAWDGEGWRPAGDDGEPLEGADYLSWKDLHDRELALEWWQTESVYLTREEGEAYGKARHYNYTEGWRVYCVCAEGRLGELLREHA